jgi:hypothetical protein
MKQIKYIFLLSIIFFACDEINLVNDFSKDYTFICVLKSDQVTQKAYLYKAIDIKGDLGPANAFIPDAEIIISDDKISSQLQVYGSSYSDNSVFHGKILPNTRYDVQIKVNNEIVTGSTTTPGGFAINRQSNDTVYLYQNATNVSYRDTPISWSESANSFRYVVYSTIIYRNNAGEEIERPGGHHNAVVDTSTTISFVTTYIVSTAGTRIEYYAYQIRFMVYALDKNYYDHVILSRDRAGLSAQYGVFGSMIVDTYTAYLKY